MDSIKMFKLLEEIVLLLSVFTLVCPSSTCERSPICSWCEWSNWGPCIYSQGIKTQERHRQIHSRMDWTDQEEIKTNCGLSDIVQSNQILCDDIRDGVQQQKDGQESAPFQSKKAAYGYLQSHRTKRSLYEECTEPGTCSYEEVKEVLGSYRVCEYMKNWKCRRCAWDRKCVVKNPNGCSRLSFYHVSCEESTPPVITCPQTMYITASERQTSAQVTYNLPTVTDNVDSNVVPTLIQGQPSGSFFLEGQNTIIYSAVDSAGNTNSCSFDIHVSAIRCPSPMIASPGSVQCTGGGSNLLGTQCIFNCSQPGYKIAGHRYVECLYFGYWDLDFPTCDCSHCGHPGTLQNGNLSMTGTSLGDTVSYMCFHGYRIVGSVTRRCLENGTWSGTFPSCQKDPCYSSPCSNGASCNNNGLDYQCSCPSTKRGRHCDQDTAPPTVRNCPSSLTVYTQSMSTEVSWTSPEFEDSLSQSNMTITNNYKNNTALFPLGSHVVSYTALKLNNGQRSECTFTIDVRANPCDALNKSENSVLLCNDWQVHTLSVCIQVCQERYEPLTGYDEDTVYVCGGSGQWLPTRDLPTCIESPKSSANNTLSYRDCMDHGDRKTLSKDFIQVLQSSHFKYLCDSPLCTEENVYVKC